MHPNSPLRRFAAVAAITVGSLACGASPGSTDPAVPSSNVPPASMGMGGAEGTPSPPTTTTVPTPPKSGTGGALSETPRPATWVAATPVGGRGGASGAGGTDPLGGHVGADGQVGADKPVPGWSRSEVGVEAAKPRPAPRTTDEAKSLGWFR